MGTVLKADVDKVRTIMQIAENFSHPLELVREALSNSKDWYAKDVWLKVYYQPPTGSDKKLIVEVKDNGIGMNKEGFERFVTLGSRLEDRRPRIGTKGFGTKIFFKSDRIDVHTVRKGAGKLLERQTAYCDKPWEKLKANQLPEFILSDPKPVRTRETGTTIKITGLKIDPAQIDNFRLANLKDYIRWKTATGSFEHYFKPTAKPPTVHLEIRGIEPGTKRANITGFELPPECLTPKPKPSDKFPFTTSYCRRFQSQIPAGQAGTVDVVGAVFGDNARQPLKEKGVRIRAAERFGVYFARDYIMVEKIDNVLPSSEAVIPNCFLFVANCQELDLTTNRNEIQGKKSAKYEDFIKSMKEYMRNVFETCKKPFFNIRIQEKRLATWNVMRKAIEKYRDRKPLPCPKGTILLPKIPQNEFDVTLLLQSMITSGRYPHLGFKIGSYCVRGPDLLVEVEREPKYRRVRRALRGNPQFFEVHYKLSDFIKHKHLPQEVDGVVLWDVEPNFRRKKPSWELLDAKIKYKLEGDTHYLSVTPEGKAPETIPIYVLKDILKKPSSNS